jgi:hypothetical protein
VSVRCLHSGQIYHSIDLNVADIQHVCAEFDGLVLDHVGAAFQQEFTQHRAMAEAFVFAVTAQ